MIDWYCVDLQLYRTLPNIKQFLYPVALSYNVTVIRVFDIMIAVPKRLIIAPVSCHTKPRPSMLNIWRIYIDFKDMLNISLS